MRPLSPVEIRRMAPNHLRRNSVAIGVIAALLVVLFSIEIFVFAREQNIWLDESTQLSGISLKFSEMLRWLVGADSNPDRLGVPEDRMPPLSYVLDWLWLRLHGPSELGFRLYHAAFVVGGVSWLAFVQWRQLGRLATLVSLGFLVLSPKLIQAGVEIRAYPIFFALTCVQTGLFLRLVARPPKVDLKILLLFATVCMAAVYTHFYGIVSSCAFFVGLGLAFVRRPAALATIICVFAVLAVGSVPLWLFVLGATQVPLYVPANATAPAIADTSIFQYVGYLLKLVGDAANMVSIPAAALFFSGAIALVGASAIAAGRRVATGHPRPSDWLIAVVVSGVLATVMASLVVKTFDALKPSYSVWLMAPISILVGAGAASITGFRLWDGLGRRAATCALFAGAALATYLFLNHASMFVHGPQGFIAALYDKAETPRAIIYERGAAWGWSFVPLQYSRHGEAIQYRAQDDGVDLVRAAGGLGANPIAQDMAAAVAPYRVLLLTDIELRTYRDIRLCQNQPMACPKFPPGPIEAALIGTGKWKKIDRQRKFGFYDSQVTVLERIEN
ncbi:hypothetical protein [Bradyrhizobium sp.]|uniref:hypothetical protein n=1 Tax=Bradyrhizobium sp. TaxID=376 RepID=UPI0039E2D52D